ncbi:MAG: glycosyltransferase family 2 protein [Patescibacteria group bacterium]
MKVVLVLPAYNAEKTLEMTVNDVLRGIVDEIILVDDFSNDKTLELAKKLNLTTHKHEKNKGYGANQKTCYKLALERGADIVIMLHPDYQYDPKLINYFVNYIKDGYFDVMLGSRIRSRKETLAGGMPKYKYYSNRMLTLIENVVSQQNLSEWHTGYRAYRREVLESIDYNKFSDDFVFDTQMLFAIIEKGFKIGEIPVPVRYLPESSSINWYRSIRYGLTTLKVAGKFFWKRLFSK